MAHIYNDFFFFFFVMNRKEFCHGQKEFCQWQMWATVEDG